ncbi:glycosyltransferase family 39 protein [Myxococcota bacterium]|nr:glycosyltransferase family 39 protein [Myxococcota bacterium]
MYRPAASNSVARLKNPVWWQVPVLLVVGTAYQSLFYSHGINRLDECWPLYAAMQLHAGETLYEGVLWVFPPGHVLPAWLASWLAPPGIGLSRLIYSAFDLALSVSMLFLGRRLMPSSFAFLAALLVTLAAPRSHFFQLLFAYRYLVFSVLALLAFARRLDSDDVRWMVAAGVCAGVALYFRLTPAFAVSCGIGVAVMAADTSWRRWLRDWGAYALGLSLVMVPVLIWFAASVGLPRLWHEVVEHPLGMLQAMPPPVIGELDWGDRRSIYEWFVAVQFRAHWFLYGGFALALAVGWVRDWMQGRAFRHALLLAVVVWGGIYFIRSLGRSDEAHLDSAIPPICLLAAYGLGLGFRAVWPRQWSGPIRGVAEGAVVAVSVAAWIFMLGTDLYLDRERRGTHLIQATADLGEPLSIYSGGKANQIDRVVRVIKNRTLPEEKILNMAETPMFHVLTGRLGPGHFDVVMPGTFMSEEQERGFLDRLRADPPAAVVWPVRDFDDMPERSVVRTAPLISEWVLENYRQAGGAKPQRRWIVLLPPREKMKIHAQREEPSAAVE